MGGITTSTGLRSYGPDEVERIDDEAPTSLVGSAEGRERTTAARVTRDGADDIVFSDEEAIDVYSAWRTAGGYSWWRMEVRPVDDDAITPRVDDVLTMTEHPWRGEAPSATFRAGKHRPMDKRMAFLTSLATDDLESTMRAVDAQEHAVFESSSKKIVAGFSRPMLSEEIKHKNDAACHYVFGVCHAGEREGIVAELVERGSKLVRAATNGDLRIPVAGGRYTPVPDDVAPELWNAAVCAAMAGPPSQEKREWLEEHHGLRVLPLSEDIFKHFVKRYLDKIWVRTTDDDGNKDWERRGPREDAVDDPNKLLDTRDEPALIEAIDFQIADACAHKSKRLALARRLARLGFE